MIQKSLITILLLSTWAQSLTMVTAMEDEDMAQFTQPMSQLTSPASSLANVIPAGGADAVVGGLIPDAQSLAKGGFLSKREQSDMTESGSGIATSSGEENNDSIMTIVDGLSLKKRITQTDGQGYANMQQVRPDHGSTSVSLIDLRRRALLLNKDGVAVGGETTVSELRRRSKEKISMLSGAEEMDHARQGVVVGPQGKSNSLANVRRRMINNVVKNLQEKMQLGAGN